MSEQFYSIENIVNFSLQGPKKFVESFRYKNYITDSKEIDIDFQIKLEDFEADLRDCQILDDKYYVKKDYFYCKDEYKLLKWEVEISNFEKKKPVCLRINITSKILKNSGIAYALIEGYIIDAMIHYALNEKGYTLIHASCASKNGKAQLFIARGGGGKTSIILQLIKAEFKFVSDNFTIISPNKKIVGFIEPLNIFTYNIDDYLYDKMNTSQKWGLKFKHLLYKLTNGYLKIFTRLNPIEIFSDRIEKKEIELESAFLLSPNTDLIIPKLDKLSKKELIDHIYLNQNLEFPYFDKYISAYSYAFPNTNFSKHWIKYKENLDKNLSENINIYKIKVPLKYTKEAFDQILTMVNNNDRIT